MIFWVKYGVQADIRFTMIKRGVVDLAVSADWTPVAADGAISKDGGNFADLTNAAAIIGGTPTRSVAGWKLTLTASELTCAEATIQIIDASTKAVEDNFLTVYTYGNASAKFAGDWSDLVRLGLTALPNAAAEAAGGLYTRGTGAGQINQPANGLIGSDLQRILNTAPTEGAGGRLAGAFTKFFDKASPTGTINSIPDAVPGAAGGLLVDDVWTDARAAKLDNLDTAVSTRLASASYTAPDNTTISTINTNVSTLLTRIPAALFSGITSLAQWLGLIAGKQTGDSTARTEIRATGAGSGTYDETTDSQEAIKDTGVASVSGAVGSVTGNVGGNVAGSVGSVTGNVGGNVAGSVGSVTGNVGGNVTGSVGSLATQAKADVNAEMVDVLVTDTYAEPSSVPAATSSLKDKIGWLFTLGRNKRTQTATTELVRNDGDSATVGTSTKSDDGTTFTRGKYS